MMPPEESTPEEILQIVEAVRQEHLLLLDDIAAARQWQATFQTQLKQLQDQADHLSREQTRLQNWENQLKVLDDGVNKHYTLVAQQGTLLGDVNGQL